NDFNAFGRTWQVQVAAAPRFRTRASELKKLQVRNQLGEMLPLGTVARAEDITGPTFVQRYNMYTSASVTGNLAPGGTTGEAIDAVSQLAQKVGVTYEWTELFFLQLQAGNVSYYIFALGTLLVYLVLAAKYESWRLPVAVILVVPLCVLAAVTGMAIAKLP